MCCTMKKKGMQKKMNRNELKELLETGRNRSPTSTAGIFPTFMAGMKRSGISWDYDSIVRQYLKKDMKLLDYDTGGR